MHLSSFNLRDTIGSIFLFYFYFMLYLEEFHEQSLRIDICGRNRKRCESPPSFCNGLGTIYIMSSQGMTFFDLTT